MWRRPGVLAACAAALLLAVPGSAQNSRKAGLTGWDYFRQKRYADALELLSKDQRLYPWSHEVLDGVGWCHFFLGDLEAAEAAFQKALEIDKGYRFSLLGLEEVRRARYGALERAEALARAGKWAAAERAFGAVLEGRIAPAETVRLRTLRGRGEARLRLGRPAEALLDFQEALRLDRADGPANSGLGRALFALRRFQPAEEAFEKALRAAPDQLEVCLLHAWCAYHKANYPLGLQRFSAVLTRFPASWGAMLGLAWCHERAGRPEKSLEFLGRAVAADPQGADPDALEWMRRPEAPPEWSLAYGFALIEAGRTQAALAFFASPPARLDAGAALLGRALAALRLGEAREAARLLRPLVEQGQDPARDLREAHTVLKVSAASVLGWALLDLGDPEQAEAAFERAASPPDERPDALAGRGCALLARHRHAQAEEALRRALALRPDHPRAAQALERLMAWRMLDFEEGRAALAAGDLDRAGRIFEGLRRDPLGRFPASRADLLECGLGEIALARADHAGAAARFQAALAVNAQLSEAFLGLGRARLEAGDAAAAVPHLEEAAARRPEDPAPCRFLARALAKAGRAAEALGRLEGWRGAFPEDAPLAVLHARMLLAENRLVEARIAFQAALALDLEALPAAEVDARIANHPEFVPLLGTLGWALLGRGRAADAEKRFLAAAEKEPGDATHTKGLAFAVLARSRFDEAEKHARAYLAALGKTAWDAAERRATELALGWSFYAASEHARALACFQRIEKADQAAKRTDPELQAALGWTWLRLNKPQPGRECFLRALADSPRLETALQGLEALQARPQA